MFNIKSGHKVSRHKFSAEWQICDTNVRKNAMLSIFLSTYKIMCGNTCRVNHRNCINESVQLECIHHSLT